MDILSAKALGRLGEVVDLAAESFPDLMDRSVLELVGPVVEGLPGRFEMIFFIGGSRSPVGVGERKGRSAVGVVDGDMKATFLFTSTVMAVVVVIVVAFETLLVMGSGGWETLVRVEGTASSSAGLKAGKAGWLDCVGVDEELAVEVDSTGSRAGSCSIGGSCLDSSGNGLLDLTGLGAAVINGVGGQPGRGPIGGIFSL
jgi:hypothetical protein